MRAVPRLLELNPIICLTAEEKARKNLSPCSRRVPVGTMKIHKHIIRIYRQKNKNALEIFLIVKHVNETVQNMAIYFVVCRFQV